MGTWYLRGGMAFSDQGILYENSGWSASVNGPQDRELFLRDEDLVFPGLVDFHVHVNVGGFTIGVSPQALKRSGVLLVGDAGTCGWKAFSPESESQESGMVPEIKRWLSLIPQGLADYPFVSAFSGLGTAERQQIAAIMTDHRAKIAGFKIRLGQVDVTDDRRQLTEGVQCARAFQVPLMVHVTGAFLSPEAIVEPLVAGDVITHVFHGRQGSFAADAFAMRALGDAVGRGVWLDVGHGSRHFSWSTFQRLRAMGIIPHTISTDITQKTWRKSPVYDLPYVISKLRAGGLWWPEIYRGVVTNPLRFFGQAMFMNSAVVLRYRKGAMAFSDAQGQVLKGLGHWRPIVVVDRGHIVKNVLAGKDGEW